MRFSVEQHFASPCERVVGAMADPELYRAMPELPKLSRPEVLAHDVDGTVVVLRLRYRFEGDLSSAVRAVVDPSRLSWVEVSSHDLESHRGTFTLEPDHYADRLRCSGSFHYLDVAGGCYRHVEGDLRVRAPLVAGSVERAIVSGLREHLEEQAHAVDTHLGLS